MPATTIRFDKNGVMTKWCPKCEKGLEITNFFKTSVGWSAYCKECNYLVTFQQRYGIDISGYKQLTIKQNNKCAICGKEPSGKGNERKLHVDHNNKTKVIRGLLCGKCNKALGLFGESIDLLIKAAEYLLTEGK